MFLRGVGRWRGRWVTDSVDRYMSMSQCTHPCRPPWHSLHNSTRLASTSLPPPLTSGGRGGARRHPGTTCPRGRMLLVEVVTLVRPLPLRPEEKRRERRRDMGGWIVCEGLGCGGLASRRRWFPGPHADACCCRRGMNCCCAVGAHSRTSLARIGRGGWDRQWCARKGRLSRTRSPQHDLIRVPSG